MRFSTTASLALAALLPAFLSGTPQPSAPSGQVGPGSAWPESCKPEAPLAIELITGQQSGGPLQVDFRLTPGIDVLTLDVAVRLLGSAQILALHQPQAGPHLRGAVVSGHLTLGLLQAAAGGADLTFSMTLADAAAASGRSTLSVERRVQRGQLPQQDGFVIVEHDGQDLAQIPSNLRPRTGR